MNSICKGGTVYFRLIVTDIFERQEIFFKNYCITIVSCKVIVLWNKHLSKPAWFSHLIYSFYILQKHAYSTTAGLQHLLKLKLCCIVIKKFCHFWFRIHLSYICLCWFLNCWSYIFFCSPLWTSSKSKF